MSEKNNYDINNLNSFEFNLEKITRQEYVQLLLLKKIDNLNSDLKRYQEKENSALFRKNLTSVHDSTLMKSISVSTTVGNFIQLVVGGLLANKLNLSESTIKQIQNVVTLYTLGFILSIWVYYEIKKKLETQPSFHLEKTEIISLELSGCKR